jgi:HD-GYP domain-containing protein (c-di-GMP phosphodiesterase class II)
MKTTLTISRGNDADRAYDLQEFPVSIGRSKDNDIHLQDSKIADFHLRIKKRGRLHIVENLEPQMHAYINGERFINSILKNQDKILIGDTEVLFLSVPDIDISEMTQFSQLTQKNLITTDNLWEIYESPSEILSPLVLQHSNIKKLILTPFNSDLKLMFNHLLNINLLEDLDGTTQYLLKAVSSILPQVHNLLFFIWSKTKYELVPLAQKKHSDRSSPFLLNNKALNEAIAHKHAFVVSEPSRKEIPIRVVIPVLHHNEMLGILHLEIFSDILPSLELEQIQNLLNQSAASFAAILLKKELDSLMLGFVETIVGTIEAKDTYTVGHSERVCKYSMAIADELKLDKETKNMLMISSLCHDIGKIGIPDSILKKASFLTHEEYEEMKLHPIIGANTISHMPNAQKFISGVKYHHEKWDGTGYPEGLAGEKIPFFGRIVAVADVFDAMVSGRSYSGFLDESDAIEKIKREAELFDPEILKALVRAWENGAITLKTSTISNIKKP